MTSEEERLRKENQDLKRQLAALQQAQAGVSQALANFKRGEADTELARVTAQRFAGLTSQGVVSRQDNDRYQAQHQSLVAGQQALQEAITLQRSNVSAAEANV